MIYKLHFIKKSKKEWDKLNFTIKEQFKKKLEKRLEEPIVPHDKLSGYENVYKIKLRSSGFRLAYEVKEDKIIIVVLAVGKRKNNDVYNSFYELGEHLFGLADSGQTNLSTNYKTRLKEKLNEKYSLNR